MKKIWRYKWLLLIASFGLSAQENDGWKQAPKVSGMIFMDVFYTYDFNQPQSTLRQPFLYNHNRHNELNLNLSLVKLEIENPKYRANVALQTGTYPNDNYAAE